MKNRLPFAALTFAFTIAGACLGHLAATDSIAILAIFLVAGIGGFAAALSGNTEL